MNTKCKRERGFINQLYLELGLLHSAAQYSLGKEPPTKLPSLTTTFDDVAAVVVRYLVATLGPLILAKLILGTKSF